MTSLIHRWEVEPRKDTLVLFRADKMLHKVTPAHAPRYALTVFMSEGDSAKEREAAMIQMMSSYI